MLMGIDVGNTLTAVGVFDEEGLKNHWCISTKIERTAEEVALILGGFMSFSGLDLRKVDGLIISSVVPEMTTALARMGKEVLGLGPVLVDSRTDIGIPILYEDPKQVGADRLVNAVAVVNKYHVPAVVVDFGTATTLDAISKEGEYLGGTITPGVEISADALFHHAARLPRVEITAPPRAIGRDTVESIQAGLVFGTAGEVDRLVELFKEELGGDPIVVATGGLASCVVGNCRTVDVHDPLLTLEGLEIIYKRVRGGDTKERK